MRWRLRLRGFVLRRRLTTTRAPRLNPSPLHLVLVVRRRVPGAGGLEGAGPDGLPHRDQAAHGPGHHQGPCVRADVPMCLWSDGTRGKYRCVAGVVAPFPLPPTPPHKTKQNRRGWRAGTTRSTSRWRTTCGWCGTTARTTTRSVHPSIDGCVCLSFD